MAKVKRFNNVARGFFRYQLDKKISEKNATFSVPNRRFDRDRYGLGPIGSGIIASLIRTKGIVEVVIKPYELCVKKRQLFSWDDIEPQILEAIRVQMGEFEFES